MSKGYVVLLFSLAAGGCAASTKSNTARTGGTDEDLSSLIDEKSENEDKAIIAEDQCYGEGHLPRQCEYDSDCCKGFYCGRDPQVSDVMKVCMKNQP